MYMELESWELLALTVAFQLHLLLSHLHVGLGSFAQMGAAFFFPYLK